MRVKSRFLSKRHLGSNGLSRDVETVSSEIESLNRDDFVRLRRAISIYYQPFDEFSSIFFDCMLHKTVQLCDDSGVIEMLKEECPREVCREKLEQFLVDSSLTEPLLDMARTYDSTSYETIKRVLSDAFRDAFPQLSWKAQDRPPFEEGARWLNDHVNEVKINYEYSTSLLPSKGLFVPINE